MYCAVTGSFNTVSFPSPVIVVDVSGPKDDSGSRSTSVDDR